MGLIEIKKELRKLTKDKLIDLVVDLYKKNKPVKALLDFYINPNEKELFLKYQEKIKEAFYPRKGDDYKLKDGKQAISDFKKLGPSTILIADLMLLYVETGVKFTNEYGDMNEGFYSSMESTYVAALKLMKKEGILAKFVKRAAKVVTDTKDIGWGLHDYLGDVYCDFYSDFTAIITEENEPDKKVKIIKAGRR